MICKLRIAEAQYTELLERTSSGNAAVLGFCGRRTGEAVDVLCVRELRCLPAVEQPDAIEGVRQRAESNGWGIVVFRRRTDQQVQIDFPDSKSANLCCGIDAVVDLFDDGTLQGRMCSAGTPSPISLISVAGTDLHFWFGTPTESRAASDFNVRFGQAFGARTRALLQRLSIAVVGCSGTGSIVIEQLARLGAGHLVLVDPDIVEAKNLDRILNATMDDARLGHRKVDVLARAIDRMGLGTHVDPIPYDLLTLIAVKRVAECDALFGCVDGAEGRYVMNKLAAFYSMPYIDVGVRLDADGEGGINQVCGTVHYLKPGGSSLLSRKAITMKAVEAEGLKRTNPQAYESRLKSKYIIGVQEDRPAVIPVNMHYASLAVIEFLARLHSFRVEGNAPFAQLGSSLSDPRFEPVLPDGEPCHVLSRHVGRGDAVPLLDNPYLSEEQ